MKNKQLLSKGLSVTAVLLLIGAGCTTATTNNNAAPASDPMPETHNGAEMMEDDSNDSAMNSDAPAMAAKMDDKKTVDTAKEDVSVASVGVYEDYTEGKLAMASTKEKDTVLFFHADFCSSCNRLDKNLKAAAADIPGDVQIVKVDYSTQNELKKKYGVTTYHTFVQIDENGNEVNQWSGGSTLDDVLSNVQS